MSAKEGVAVTKMAEAVEKDMDKQSVENIAGESNRRLLYLLAIGRFCHAEVFHSFLAQNSKIKKLQLYTKS